MIHIEVHGQRYPIRTTLDARYVQELAAYVDRKMAGRLGGLAVQRHGRPGDADRPQHRRRVLPRADAAADEADSLTARAEALERIVDQALQLAGHDD